MLKKIALVSDFDGTISDNDFFYYIAEKYFDEKMLEPWQQYLAGKKKHFDALNEMFSQLRVSSEELKNFIKGIKIDKSFYELAEFCENRNIPVYVCSAGCDFYILELLGDNVKKYNLRIVSNKGRYSSEQGLRMFANEEFFDVNLGVSKTNLVKHLKVQGFYVIYCGDGIPDIEPAMKADEIFARKNLYEYCREKNIRANILKDFSMVKNYIEEIEK